MATIPIPKGLYDVTACTAWLITTPYEYEKYIFVGSEADAKAEGKKAIFRAIGRTGRDAEADVREINLERW